MISGREYLELLAGELAAVALPDGPRRRVGPDSAYGANLDSVRADLASTRELLHEGDLALDPVETGADLALETASLLFAAGAAHPAWRRWSALSALGRLLGDEPMDACLYAVLAGEWGYVERLGRAAPPAAGLPRMVVWRLATGAPPAAGEPGGDDIDRAWVSLAHSIPAGDHARTEAALAELARFWMLEDEEWDRFHPRSYPDFEPEVCAAARLARRHGYVPAGLDPEAARFLEPGLADGEPEPLPSFAQP